MAGFFDALGFGIEISVVITMAEQQRIYPAYCELFAIRPMSGDWLTVIALLGMIPLRIICPESMKSE